MHLPSTLHHDTHPVFFNIVNDSTMSFQETTSFSTDQTREAFIEQVQRLRKDVQSLYASFHQVSRILGNILDSRHLPSAFRNEVERLDERWHGIQKAFRHVLWSSRDLSGDARSTAIDFILFIDHVLCNPHLTDLQKREAIETYRNHASNQKNRSQDISDELKNLSIQIEAFSRDWKETVHKKGIYQYTLHFVKCAEDIAALDHSLSQLRTKIILMSFALVCGVAAGTAFVVVSILHGCFDPTILPDLFAPSSKALTRLRKAISDMIADRKQRKKLRTELEELQTIGLSDIENIVSRLVTICSIWTSIAGELKTVQELMDGVSEQKVLENRLQVTRNLYITLSEVFYEYQVAIPSTNL
ncbi:unnamed protein product [Somion occarium]|uniref:Uncharacterized protein n=1 Tax=Somion occarium TaxID=3059160 RepID=A0ABP1E8U0_9APHY